MNTVYCRWKTGEAGTSGGVFTFLFLLCLQTLSTELVDVADWRLWWFLNFIFMRKSSNFICSGSFINLGHPMPQKADFALCLGV